MAIPLPPSLLRLVLHGVLAVPWSVRRRRYGDPPRNARGTTLDHDLHTLLRLEERFAPALPKGAPTEARAAMRRSVAVVERRSGGTPGVDGRVEGVPIREYQVGAGRTFVFLHGGGWVQGDLDTHDALCRRIATDARWDVVAVDYRLAPEHPFPAGLEDALTVLRWARRRTGRLAVGGDSAGGNLAAAACLVLRDGGEALPDLQVLVYPGLDQRKTAPSHREFARGFLLTAADIDWFQAHYAPVLLDPRASPLLAEHVRGLPPAVITTAGFDPLRDEGEAYAARLRDAGVAVSHLDEADLVHGYANMDGMIPAADRAVARFIAAISTS